MDENPYKPADTVNSSSDKGSQKSSYGALKIVLIALGIVMLLIILMFVWAGVKTSTTYSKLEGKAEPLIKEVLKGQSPWNYETLKPHLSKLWLESVSEEDAEKLMRLYSKLGDFHSVKEVNWQRCSTNSSTEYGTIDRCDYVALTKYENGDANVFVGVIVEENLPKIIQIHINSDVFME